MILFGPSGTGKTEFCKSLFKSMNYETVLVRDMNALGNIDIGRNQALLFDDISLSKKTREEKIHCFDLENDSQLRILYGVARIPASIPRAFTTNKIDRVVGSTDLSAIPEEISRRITAINIDKSLMISVERTITVTEKIKISTKDFNKDKE